MGWDEVPVAPTVTMSCPGATVYGEPPTVTATVNQSATIVFYLDGTQVSSSSGTSASYTPGTDVSVGTHAIQVVASNTNGSDSVTCSWVVNPSAPTVTMECPGATGYGTPPTLTADVDQSATIVFYLDGTQVSSGSGTSASYTLGTSVSVGTHTIEVIASNTNGSDNVSCSWTVAEPLYVSFSDPAEYKAFDPVGSLRTFSVIANKPATLEFFIDGMSANQIFTNVQSASFLSVQSGDGHIIQVNARTLNESVWASCSWGVIGPVPTPTPAINLDTNECENAVREGESLSPYVKITAALYESNGQRYIVIDYVAARVGTCTGSSTFFQGTYTISTSWPEINEGGSNGPSYIHNTFNFSSWRDEGRIFYYIPQSSYYYVCIEVNSV